MLLIKRFGYFSKEAWISYCRGGLMTLVAASTVTISLFIMGIFMLVFFNFYNLLNTLQTKLDIAVYISPHANNLDELNLRISQISGVKRMEFVSKETAWQEFKESHPNLRLDDYVQQNPLPDSFKVEVKDLSYVNIVASKISGLSGVEDVRYGGEIADRVAAFIKIISMVSLTLIGLLLISTIMIVTNTIRLTVIARQNEINIMSLVGASRSFIKYPFILEGIYIGITGSLISVSTLKLGYDLAVLNIERNMPFMPINLNSYEIYAIFGAVFIIGIVMGWLGAYVSVSKSFKFKTE